MENYFLGSLETHIFVALIGSYGQCYLPEGGNRSSKLYISPCLQFSLEVFIQIS